MTSLPLRHPFELPELGRAYIVRVSPVEPYAPDLERPWEPDEAFWLLYGALDGKARKPLSAVMRYCKRWGTTHPALMVAWALWHPDTPFGIGYQPQGWHPIYRQMGLHMLVNFRGRLYTRDQRGVLTDTGHDLWHPDPQFFRCVVAQVIREREDREGWTA